MSNHYRLSAAILLPAVMAGVYACAADSSTSPHAAARSVSFSVSTAASAAALPNGAAFATAPTASGFAVAAGKDTLVIDSVRMVLAQVTLWRAADTTCGDEEHDDERDAGCAPLRTGPMLVRLPLDTGTKQVFAVSVPLGAYDGIALRVHKPTPNPADSNTTAFLAVNPNWANISVRVDGTFDGQPFHWAGDPVIPMREFFHPPVVVSDTSGINFTLHVAVGRWFVSRDGALLNPGSLTQDQAELVSRNIRKSLHAFDDDHRSGRDDHEHDTGDGGHG